MTTLHPLRRFLITHARALTLVAVCSLIGIPACQRNTTAHVKWPESYFLQPERPPTPGKNPITYDQLITASQGTGEILHWLDGSQHGFDSLTVFISDVYPGGGVMNLHTHTTEEVFVVLEGKFSYVTEDPSTHQRETVNAQGPYVVRIPAGTWHAFANVDNKMLKQVAIFPTANQTGDKEGEPNPLLRRQ